MISYSRKIDSLCKKGQTPEAMGIFREMEEKGLAPDSFTYNILINGFCKDAKLELGSWV